MLLIEDDPELLSLMAEALTVAEFEVEMASDGLSGIEQHRLSPADLVITDVFMPDMDGIEVIVGLRRVPSAVRIIAISGGFNGGAMNLLPLARRLGADRVMAKPFRMQQLLAAVRELLDA